jgi:hypothetical protein
VAVERVRWMDVAAMMGRVGKDILDDLCKVTHDAHTPSRSLEFTQRRGPGAIDERVQDAIHDIDDDSRRCFAHRGRSDLHTWR